MMTLPAAYWYFSHVINIRTVCSLILSIYSYEGLAQDPSSAFDDHQDSPKNGQIEKSIQKNNTSWSYPMIPFTATSLDDVHNGTSQGMIVPSTQLLFLYPDVRNVILKEYLRNQRHLIYQVTKMNEPLNFNFIPSTYLENEARRNVHRYGAPINPFKPALLQTSVSITLEPLRLLSRLLKMIWL